MKLVGFCGYAGVGKDTAAQALINQGWIRMAFADELKRDLADLFWKHLHILVTEPRPEEKELIRPMLVEWGRTCRKIKPDYWIDRLFSKLPRDKDVVIPDVRYLNEIKAIEERGGVVFGIIRPGCGPANNEEAKYTTEALNYLLRHPYIDRLNLIIYNNSSIEALHGCVLSWVHWAETRGLLGRIA